MDALHAKRHRHVDLALARAILGGLWLIATVGLSAQTTGPSSPTTPQHVICDSGCGTPPASADGTTFTAGVTNVSLIGAAFNDALAAVTAGTYAAPRITAFRALHINLRDAAGVEFGTTANPLTVQDPFGGTFLTDAELRNSPFAVTITNTGTPIEVGGVGGASIPVFIADSGAATIGKVNLAEVTSGTNATIKVASTLPALTDTALVTTQRDPLPAGTNVIGHVVCDSGCAAGAPGQQLMAASSPVVIASDQSAVPVSGTFFQVTQPVSLASAPTTAVTNAGLTNLDVALSTRTKPADQQHAIVDSGTVTTVTSLSQMAGAAIAMNTGTRAAGVQRVTIATDDLVPVSGPLTDTQLRATAVPVSGTVTATTGGLTDTQLRASAVPISGTTTVTQATGTNLHAVMDSGSTTAVTQATGSNLHAVIDTGSTTAVTQATGTNLHMVSDSGTITTVTTVTNLSQMAGAAIAMGTGTRAAGVQRVTVATDDVVPASQSGTWTVQPGNTANTTAWLVTDNPTTATGNALTSVGKATVTASVNVKGSAGNVYGLFALNGAASTCWVQFINSATAGTIGSGIIFAIPLPASTTVPIYIQPAPFALGAFSAGIAVGIATTATGAVACGTGGNLTVMYQ